MTQEQVDEMYADIALHEKEVFDHNQEFIKSLDKKGQSDFEELINYCDVTGKINLVDAPKGDDQKEHCGVFKKVHVDQWSVGMEGDSYKGFIYAKLKGQWIEVPYSC